MICDGYCRYFPQDPAEIISEGVTDGIKTRTVNRKCEYDGHKICNFIECKYYKKNNERKNGDFLPILEENDAN